MAAEEPHPQRYRVNTWFFVCGPLAVNTFLFGLAANVYIFKKHGLAFDRVMDMRADEIPSARGVARTAAAMSFLQIALFNGEAWRRGEAFGVDETRMELLLVLYILCAATLLLCPLDILHRSFRMFVVRTLARCLWPFQNFSLQLPSHPTPFVEVFLADGLTSLSKFIQDSAVALSLLSMSFVSEPIDLREAYISKLKQSPLPYFAASVPYVLLVIFVGAYPMLLGLARPEHSSFFLLCAVFNSLYSFLWDVIMDWGLGQPKLPRRVMFLRHQLTYTPHKLYYVVIAVDFVLRIMWVTKWWDWMHRGVHFKLIAQVAEVVRRVIWNFVRVEWQCIKLDILGRKKLSADSMELEQSIESMPLMDEEESSDGKSVAGKALPSSVEEGEQPRMRTRSRANSVVLSEAAHSGDDLLSMQTIKKGLDRLGFFAAADSTRAVSAEERVVASSTDVRSQQQEQTTAAAAITVASYPHEPQAMSTHQRRDSSSMSSGSPDTLETV
ncbi:hypothetical protein BBJ28_00018421 [Nothophytophthora sp. Chile5]|nr:hypothetical protein BBJ28_00018421 [Nothophytophthora sp. Chile5]